MRFKHKDWKPEHLRIIYAKISHFNDKNKRRKALYQKPKPITWGQAYQKSIRSYIKLINQE